MAFNTTSYLAGIGSVVAVLSTGFAGGYLLSNPSRVNPPNRLQRVAALDQDSRSVTVVAASPKSEVKSEPEAKPEVIADASPTAAAPQATTESAAATPPAVTPGVAAATVHPQANAEKTAPDNMMTAPKADRARTAEVRSVDNNIVGNKAADRKRIETRKFSEQQRRQRELEVATIAVRRIVHERDAQEVADTDPQDAPASEMPHFSLFGR